MATEGGFCGFFHSVFFFPLDFALRLYFLSREKVPKAARGLVSEHAATRPRTPFPAMG